MLHPQTLYEVPNNRLRSYAYRSGGAPGAADLLRKIRVAAAEEVCEAQLRTFVRHVACLCHIKQSVIPWTRTSCNRALSPSEGLNYVQESPAAL